MKSWADFQEHYLFDVHGCTYAVAERAVRNAAREFCERTGVLRTSLDPVVTHGAISIYPFDAASQMEVVKVLSASLDGQELALLLPDEAGSGARGLVVLNPAEFLLQPVPATGQKVLVTATLTPSLKATGIDDLVYARHAEAIAQGAKARLYDMAEQPFSNPERAAKARENFEEAVGKCARDASKGYSRAPQRTVPSFF